MQWTINPVRNAEARSSTLLCSTNFSPLNNLPLQDLIFPSGQSWPEKTAQDGRKPKRKVTDGNRLVAVAAIADQLLYDQAADVIPRRRSPECSLLKLVFASH